MILEHSNDLINRISVNMGHLHVNSNPNTVYDTFVGSCVALCLYDTKKKIGGLAHVMLPSCNVKKIDIGKQGKYADIAIDCMLSRMRLKGSEHENIIAKLAGGSQMFAHESGQILLNIGNNNIDKIQQLLEQHKIKIKATDLGGNYGRKINFHLSDGKVIVETSKNGQIAI